MQRSQIRWAVRVGAMALTLALPAAAHAQTTTATAPAVATGGAANVQQQSVRLTGTVDPNGASTTYQFQYGTTVAYGSATPGVTVTGISPRTVTADVSGLAPATKYHYRLIARNAKGLTRGTDRTFTTKVQPLGVGLTGNPNPVPFGAGTTLAGTLTGTGNGGRQVVLQSNPFPYTQGFKNVGYALVTDGSGNFSFPLLSVPLNTQFRVALPDKPAVASPIVTVSVLARVGTRLGTTRVKRGGYLTFAGSITPAVDGTLLAIQKKRGTTWVTVAGTSARHSTTTASRYSVRVKIPSGGVYRVYAGVANGSYVPATGREVTIHTHR